MIPLSFQKDIAPIFVQFRDSMAWRLDLTNYADVMTNAKLILSMIQTNGGMPPPPYSPLDSSQVDTFTQWMNQGYPP
jgi:hypothetical protein